jgi:hypothetical protein
MELGEGDKPVPCHDTGFSSDIAAGIRVRRLESA